MAQFRKILACVDLSQFSEAVLDHTKEIVLRQDCEILVYNVINQRDIDHVEDVRNHYYLGMSGKNMGTQEYIKKEKEKRSEELSLLVEKHLADSNAKVSIRVDTGFPHKAILETVKTEKADLLVLGHKGRGNFADTFIGSIALRVLRKSPIPVLSVR